MRKSTLFFNFDGVFCYTYQVRIQKRKKGIIWQPYLGRVALLVSKVCFNKYKGHHPKKVICAPYLGRVHEGIMHICVCDEMDPSLLKRHSWNLIQCIF